MGDRVVDCARLESVCTARYQGFESPPIRVLLLLFLFAGSLGAAESDLMTARSEYQKRNFPAALSGLDRFDKSDSANADALDLRGCIYLEQQKFEEARKAFAAAHSANADLFAPRIHAADALMLEKKFAEARAAYRVLLGETNILVSNERLRFATLLTFLGEHNEAEARAAFEAITFPTQSPAYYFAQAAWLFAHDKKRDAAGWLEKAAQVYDTDTCSWFEQHLYHFGWLKSPPPLNPDPK